eukprot:6196788-Pleurochrysis_carterae.AAC.3
MPVEVATFIDNMPRPPTCAPNPCSPPSQSPPPLPLQSAFSPPFATAGGRSLLRRCQLLSMRGA